MKKINIGKENATFQEILALKENRAKRAKKKMFFVEGVQNIKDAISNNWEIFAFIYCDFNSLSDWAKGVLNKAENQYCLSKDLMRKLGDKDDLSELLAIIKMKEQKVQKFTNNPLIVILDRPSKKGNLGTNIRTCDAMGVEQIFFTGHAVDIYDHNVITSSMGSFFKVPIKFLESNEGFENIVRELKNKYHSFQLVGTSLQADMLIQNCDFTKPTMLLVGNEAMGLSKYYNDKCDKLVKIDMRAGIDSLNVSCATAIALYEINRQR